MKKPKWLEATLLTRDPLMPVYRIRQQVRWEWQYINRWAVQKLRGWERRYYTPYEGERIDACAGKDVCIVKDVAIRKDEVYDIDGRMHSLSYCVDPYGYSDTYIRPFFDENGDPKDPNE